MKGLFLAVLALAAGGRAAAQEASAGIAADRFTPGLGPLALLGGEAAETTPRGELTWALSGSFIRDPIRLENRFLGSVFSRPVRGQLVGDLGLELGVHRRVAIAVGMPVVLWADGDRLRGTGADDRPLGAPAGGDLRLRVKVAVVGAARAPGLHLALVVQLTAPVGGQEQFAATDGVTGEPRLVADLRYGALLLAAQVGVRFAPERKLFTTTFGDELTWLVGGRYRVYERGRFEAALLFEAAGAVGAQAGTHPVELRGAARVSVGAWELDLGGGGGVTSDVAAPAFRVFALVRGRFAVLD